MYLTRKMKFGKKKRVGRRPVGFVSFVIFVVMFFVVIIFICKVQTTLKMLDF